MTFAPAAFLLVQGHVDANDAGANEDSDVVAFAKKTLPTLKDHLKMVEDALANKPCDPLPGDGSIPEGAQIHFRIATRHATAVSLASPGRITIKRGMARSAANCSTG